MLRLATLVFGERFARRLDNALITARLWMAYVIIRVRPGTCWAKLVVWAYSGDPDEFPGPHSARQCRGASGACYCGMQDEVTR